LDGGVEVTSIIKLVREWVLKVAQTPIPIPVWMTNAAKFSVRHHMLTMCVIVITGIVSATLAYTSLCLWRVYFRPLPAGLRFPVEMLYPALIFTALFVMSTVALAWHVLKLLKTRLPVPSGFSIVSKAVTSEQLGKS
jgi:hypothetical protein